MPDFFCPHPLVDEAEDASDFGKTMWTELQKIVIGCWDVKALKEDEKTAFRHMVRFKGGREAFA